MIIDAIIPAGGQNKLEFAEVCGSKAKSEIIIGSQTLVTSVIKAIKGTSQIRNTVVISNSAAQPHIESLGCSFLQEGSTGPENIFKGFDFLMAQEEPPTHAILSTADIPFLAPQHIQWLIENSNDGKEIYVPVVRMDDFLGLYPGCPSTFVKLADERLTLGGIFLLDTGAFLRAKPHIERVFESRKSIPKMGMLIGIGFIIKYYLKLLEIGDLENKIADILGCSGRALLGTPPELAFDVDDEEDYAYAMKWVGEHGFPSWEKPS